jgi:hypothetical protein
MVRNWLLRHRHPFNFWIHMIGIPTAVVGVVLLIAEWEYWWWGLTVLAAGYVLQWLGHVVEGNDVGEWAAIKMCFGMPVVAVAPQFVETSVQERAA